MTYSQSLQDTRLDCSHKLRYLVGKRTIIIRKRSQYLDSEVHARSFLRLFKIATDTNIFNLSKY